MAHTRFMQYELFFAGKVGGVGRVSDDLGRDEDEQVGLGRLLVAGFEQPAEHGDAAEPGDFALIVGLLIVEQAADDRRLAVLQQDGGLDQALAGGRGDELVAVGEGDEALRDPADFLLHLKAERAVVADARGDFEFHAHVLVVHGLGGEVVVVAGCALLGERDVVHDLHAGLLIVEREELRGGEHVDVAVAPDRVEDGLDVVARVAHGDGVFQDGPNAHAGGQ